ncbi:MAG: 1-deoxy-D-xylulose-5-phosphate synthase, partial [Tissierellales bacterium]
MDLLSIKDPSFLKRLNIKELEQLSKEIRDFLIKKLSKTGGHIGPNLGVVELTIALHRCFNSPKDKIIWDVGHQCYVHKILTGRAGQFDTLRQYKGLSGFPKRAESEHDIFETGHSSTSLSAAMGMAIARDLKGEDFYIVPVIGDGALTGGMALEALNHIGNENKNIIVILNDNEMSISKNVGALAEHLSKIRSSVRYNRIKRFTESTLKKIPIAGRPIIHSIERLKKSFKYLLVPGVIFEEMGFTYLGPIDGHNINTLINVLKYASKLHGPTFIHVVTQKGKGYPFAENDPEQFHGVSPFHPETGKIVRKSSLTYSEIFGKKLVELGQKDNRVVAVSAAMPESTGLMDFKKHFPERFFDVGIAEQHAVTMAAGLASNGMKPYVAIYSTFLQRAYDQILHDTCIQKLPVVFIIDRAGLVGEDGETHQGVFDISYLRHIPNITIMAPKNAEELRNMLEFTLSYD